MFVAMPSQPRKPGRPPSHRQGFASIRVSLEMRRALRLLAAEHDLGSVDQTIDVLISAWGRVLRRQQEAAVIRVKASKELAAEVPA